MKKETILFLIIFLGILSPCCKGILEQRPYDAKLIGDIWVVKGLIPLPDRYNPDWRGGTAYIEIQKKDCKILKVTHGR
jgi:hypothetical protein